MMKKIFPFVVTLLLLSFCVSCNQSSSKQPPSTTEDLGEGFSLVTDYDEQGRKTCETTYYSGEFYPDGRMYEYDSSTGRFIPTDSTPPDVVENMVMSYTLYDYDGEGYHLQIRSYSHDSPAPDIPNAVLWEDDAGRTIMAENHNFRWGITNDYYRYSFTYGEENAPVRVTIYTSFVKDTLPDTEPAVDSIQCSLSLGESSFSFLPAPPSYGIDGLSSFALYEVDEQGNYIRVSYYDREGSLTSQQDMVQNESTSMKS